MVVDLIFLAGNAILAISLLPTIFSKEKPHWATSALTATVLFAFFIAFVLEGMLIVGIATYIVAFGWFTILFQTIK